MKSKPLIAVVAMDGIFPGASNLDVFWDNIISGIDQSVPVPPKRWVAPVMDRLSRHLVPDRTYSQHACLIDDFIFDPASFTLDQDLTRHLDPVHQLTLTAGKRAATRSVTDPIDPCRVDTILAAIALPTDSASRFSRQLLSRAIESRLFPKYKAPLMTVTRNDALASRVDGLPATLLAAEMGFKGTSFTLDAACASSIYAVKLACDRLIDGRADMVVTGGVSRPECLYTQTGFSQLQALSRSGRCAPFDRHADGLVVGEGVGILVLKRLDDALAHGDDIFGVIHGIGLSNDMRGNLLAPERAGQVRAMQQAYREAGWRPSDVQLIECHGTGTRAGDTTELESLIQLWQDETGAPGRCAIGSVKSMIGHLLTAAGAAGMIKTLLAMHHQTLPPSINFKQAPSDSPLNNSPFRVQTAPSAWEPADADRLRRAAVSAFGFGGINAHILFQEWPAFFSEKPEKTGKSEKLSCAPEPITIEGNPQHAPPEPIAIVGMDGVAGPLKDFNDFTRAVFAGEPPLNDRPGNRWKGADEVFKDILASVNPQGAFIDNLVLKIGEFQIPPNEIKDILPQQLLALKVGAGAMADAGLPLRQHRERMGVVMGISFDFEATNFHLRWQLAQAVERWNREYALELDDVELKAWLESLRDGCGPPLTAPRVLGALGGVVASRMAREFRFGGPSFVVSDDTASGIHALGIAMDLLRQNAVDAMLVGAVDLGADGRSVTRLNQLMPLSSSNRICPFNDAADGTLPGDGAAALVLKRLAQARHDKDRIYAVIRGIGSASGSDPTGETVDPATYCRSLVSCFDRSDVPMDAVSYVDAHGAGVPAQDRAELAALTDFFGDPKRRGAALPPIALGATTPICGHTGAADGLIALAKTAWCLHRRILPALPGYTRLPAGLEGSFPFHMPRQAQPWYRDRKRGPRTALNAAITSDGTCSHVLLQEDEDAPAITVARHSHDGAPQSALFVIFGNTPEQLLVGLDDLDAFLQSDQDQGQCPLPVSAGHWMNHHPLVSEANLAVALVLKSTAEWQAVLREARLAVQSGASDPRSKAVFYSSHPMGASARIAMVYPGSGNHYLGMGRELALRFPDIVDGMDRDTDQLQTQVRPWILTPWNTAWDTGWEAEALLRLKSDPLNMIFAQVLFGDLMTRILKQFAVPTDAIIGYSLGESAGLFAHGIWPDRGAMLRRMQTGDLFSKALGGPCESLRQAWQVPDDQPIRWRVAVVNRPADTVRGMIDKNPYVRLLIVNTPDECVIGGLETSVTQTIKALGCQAVYLDGVVTVHCDAAKPVAEAYRDLHLFPTTPKAGLTIYSCSRGEAYPVSMEAAADSIQKQAIEGFDFPCTIEQAWDDGIRIFVEAGPRSSCTRMIDRILEGRPHLAVAVNHSADDETTSLLSALARLVAERVPLDLSALYADTVTAEQEPAHPSASVVSVPIGGHPLTPVPPPAKPKAASPPVFASELEQQSGKPKASTTMPPDSPPTDPEPSTDTIMSSLLDTARQTMEATASAHEQFLDLSQELTENYASLFDLQNRLLGLGARIPSDAVDKASPVSPPPLAQQHTTPSPPAPEVAFDRDMCMEFAIGSVGRMLGPAFDVVDTYRVRVRLPDEPLMLVDRIISVEGEMLSMGAGQVVTEHDVKPDAWYLDGNRAPVCISVEAGQADLFMCSYLGIDHQVKGQRAYRLLDAVVTFHRGLPQPGDTIRYEIAIDRFVRQGDTWMFFFRFEGYIGGEHLITMRDGCAGFFTEEEVLASGGIILTEAERAPMAGTVPADWQPLVPMTRETYNDAQVDALRRGDLAACFGERFAGIDLAQSLWLPGGRMRLIHRIVDLDPSGGRYGLGLIRAEADIHPEDWFLTCHFVDDMVMPGTLMYECCAHTLRVFLQRMGWVTDKPGVCYEPVIGNGARLKCRGPVTPKTRHVHYEIQISEIGYDPEPYVIADAHMFGDGRAIVFFKDMSMKMTGATRRDIETVWHRQQGLVPSSSVLYDRESILAFSVGKPSEAFGEPYRVFDEKRTIARLPGPPYCFMDRVIQVEPPAWELKPDGWITAQYDIPPTEWYFDADHSGVMPFCVLLEIALQPCGWLAAYVGSALRSQQDLKFRNLGGGAVLHRQVLPDSGTLTMRCRMTKVSEAAEMIIENFDFEVLSGNTPIYTGDTYFGFFSAPALGQQKGLGAGDPMVKIMQPYAGTTSGGRVLDLTEPLTPQAAQGKPVSGAPLRLPGKALLMVDRIDALIPDGGPAGLGYIRGIKPVDPGEWFFKAHFYQDPVCPGSLGLESFLQLMKTMAMERWPELARSHRFRIAEGSRHTWDYRGQIIQKNNTVVVEAVITHIESGASPMLRADGLLSVDGLPIYKMQNFELALVPAADNGDI
ncbi:beta-ketoacyl synthase N-terminal-like domain-containing protein [Desulfosarcina variabilis]|uniref:beta-ketoacyl synthase N-terminal-like domain-containing protein n=1 Tax=Desulfosarcina variabilis TaxID=2300 RepID=UPI003AFB2ED7